MWFKTPPSPKSYLVLCEKVCNQITRMLCWKKKSVGPNGKKSNDEKRENGGSESERRATTNAKNNKLYKFTGPLRAHLPITLWTIRIKKPTIKCNEKQKEKPDFNKTTTAPKQRGNEATRQRKEWPEEQMKKEEKKNDAKHLLLTESLTSCDWSKIKENQNALSVISWSTVGTKPFSIC